MDMHTLHIEHATLLGLYTLLTVVNSRLHRGTGGVNWFPIYNFYAFLGALLIVLRGSIPDPVSIIGGSLCFSLAYVFLSRSLTEFFGRHAFQWKLQVGLTFLNLIFLLQFGLISPNTYLRLTLFSLILGLQSALTAIFVLRNARRHLTEAAGLMGSLLVCLTLLFVVRGVVTFLLGAPRVYTDGSPLLNWCLLGTSVLQGGVTVAFVWMTAAELRHELRAQATTDPLTQIMNRRAIELVAGREIRHSVISGNPLSVILLDIDNFKRLNDSLGHAHGDAALRAVALCLQQSMREHDHLARFGGDEFAVLLPSTSQPTANLVAERLRSCLDTISLGTESTPIRVRTSFGVSVHHPAQDWSQLVAACDRALYQSKRLGGNRVSVNSPRQQASIAG